MQRTYQVKLLDRPYDSWSQLGCLKDLLNGRGNFDFGIDDEAHIAEVMNRHRRRRHRLNILNQVEDEIDMLRTQMNPEEDIPLWKYKEEKYSKQFSTKKTWLYLRQAQPECTWYNGVWFPQSTPKYSLAVWLAIRNRLQTCDRMKLWNSATDTTCVLCQDPHESRQHLFFSCRYSGKIWKEMVGGLLRDEFTTDWDEIIALISRTSSTTTDGFLTFQALIHSIWRERNARKHGEQPKDEMMLSKFVDKMIRLKLYIDS